MLVVAPLLLSLTLAAGPEQAKPDFAGKWTKIPTSPGEAVETMAISQTVDTLTVETESPSGVIRWFQKLDGSESKNIIKQAKAPASERIRPGVDHDLGRGFIGDAHAGTGRPCAWREPRSSYR
jgi:hypothetical protein